MRLEKGVRVGKGWGKEGEGGWRDGERRGRREKGMRVEGRLEE